MKKLHFDGLKIGHVFIAGLCFLVMALMALCIMVWKAGQDRERYVIETQTYIKDASVDDIILPKNQVAMKYKSLYARYVAIFSQKDAKKSMNQWQAADWVCKAWLYTDWMDLPKFYFVANAIMESNINPYLVGPCKELGMHQQHPAVMPYVYYTLREIRAVDQKWADELDPRINNHSDLAGNPIASLRCQAIIAWGCKRRFNSNAPWWISAGHWGDFRMYRYYDFDKEPDAEFVFYSKNGNVDRRNPLKYYFHWQSISDKLATGRLDIYQETVRELDEYQKYADSVQKDEAEYVETLRYKTMLAGKVGKLEYRVKDAEEKNLAAIATLVEVKKLLDGMEDEYSRIYQERIKRDKNYEKAYAEQRTVFGRFSERARRIFK